jgi:hypothetical protein
VVGKVETSIDPYALLGNFNVFLRVHGPLSLGGNPLSLCFVSGLHGPLAWVKGAYSCALSALHGDVGVAGGALGNHSGLVAVLSGVWRESSGVVSGPWDWRGLEARLSSACQCCIQPNVFIIARGSKAPRCLGGRVKLWLQGSGCRVDRDPSRAACSCVGIGSHGISCSRESKHVFALRQYRDVL